MAIFKCKMCGGAVEFTPGATIGECDSCGTKQTLPRLDDERRVNLYDRANHFRRANEYDKAMGIYETILNEDKTDAEAYWSLVLCKYGVEYVEDPKTRKRIPTVNRAQYTSVLADEDYKSAIQYADALQKSIYETEAKAIDEIQKGILEISQKEEPFDVFICYKETDANGRRTPDSVLATELYHELVKEGFKAFFSRITLEDKLGTAYEPYIFAALHSAKVMVVLGTKAEHFNAVWVKNEWSRYLALIQNGEKKTLIPAYKDMDPYDLPEAFSHLQAQDMAKLGFMQDLIRGIKKIIGNDVMPTPEKVIVQAAAPQNANVTALKKRGFMALEFDDWTKADGFFEEALNQDAEDAECYLGKLMAELHIQKREQLKDAAEPFDGNTNCMMASRFNAKIAEELADANAFIRERNDAARKEKIYKQALSYERAADKEVEYKNAADLFASIEGYKGADKRAKECRAKAEECRKESIYQTAVSGSTDSNSITRMAAALERFESILDYKDARTKAEECRQRIEELKEIIYKDAEEYKSKANLMNGEEAILLLDTVLRKYKSIPDYKDSRAKVDECQREIEKLQSKQEKEKAKRKKLMKRIAIIASIVVVLIALLIAFNIFTKMESQYKEAVSLLESGHYAQAAAKFDKLGNYKDSESQLKRLMDEDPLLKFYLG